MSFKKRGRFALFRFTYVLMHMHELFLFVQGGFARCYEVTDLESKEVFACKVVSKSLLVKQHQREKMAQVSKLHEL